MVSTNGPTTMSSGEKALATVHQVLADARLQPEPIPDDTGFTVAFGTDGPEVRGFAYILVEELRFLFYLEIIERAPAAQLAKVAEFITRANYGLNIGNFELDYANGGVRFKTSLDFHGYRLWPGLIRNAIVAAMDGVDAYYDALIQVMHGQAEPAAAIAAAEANFDLS